MAKQMKLLAILALSLTIVFTLLHIKTHAGLCLTLAITFGTTAYHLWMRLIVGWIYDFSLKNRVNYKCKWFQVGKTEQRLYEIFKVKKWKGKMPTFDCSAFDKRLHSWEEIAQAMCQAELVHETIVVLSFIPIIAYIWFGALEVFVITSVLSAGYDSMFIMMQRFNRPRIISMIKDK